MRDFFVDFLVFICLLWTSITRSFFMDKFKISSVKYCEGDIYQTVYLNGKKGHNRRVDIHRTASKFEKGHAFKVYKTQLGLDYAYSYKLGGKRYVDLMQRPINMSGVEGFYEKLSMFDSILLNNDICSVLRSRGIKPTFNKMNNLRLFLFELPRVR